jgi:AraC family transcriptional activator of tynA and feaB
VFTWSTDAVDARDGFCFWREAISRATLSVATESPTQRFRASITGRTFGALRFAFYQSTSHEIVRGPEHVAGAPEDDSYVVSLQLKGRSRIVQDDDAFDVEPNDIAVIDGQRPFRIGFLEPVGRAIAVVPHDMIDTRAPWLRRPSHRKITPKMPFAGLARQHLLQLATGRDDLAQAEATLLTANLCNLFALATERNVAVNARAPELQYAAILACVRQTLGNPELSPEMVATRFGISVRTLHSRFEQFDQTFSRWVLEGRLNGIAEALRDPNQLAFSISEIAYRWGFNNLSHFTRSFRARFGMTPGQWRQTRDDRQ